MTSPVRVLWLVKGLGRGGAEKLLVNLARCLDPSVVRLDVGYVLPYKDALADDLSAAQVRVHCLNRSGGRWTWPWTLRSLLAGGAFDVVHSHSPVVAAAARLLAPRSTILVHTEHNMWQRYRRPTRWMNAATFGRNALVWAVSAGVAESIKPPPGARRPPVSVLVHGIDTGAVRRRPGARRGALRSLGLEEGPFTVGSVGNLTVKKDQSTLVAALAWLRAAVPDARLVLVGDGPRRQHLQDLVHSLGLGGAVTFTGVRDDVLDLLPAFDVFALSSRHEGLPIALLEAMASGVSPVATSVGGVPEVITHERDGLLVPPGNAAALGEALHALAGDDARREAVAAAACERAGHFGIAPAADTMTQTYLSLATGRRGVRAG
ncbi:MAG: glycosyltransferase [Propionibacteriales bacterium]|nr:glycosyltransferase [Propionibacteriales bacterium]